MPRCFSEHFCIEYRIGDMWHVAYLSSNKLGVVIKYLTILTRNALKWRVDKIIVSDHLGRAAFAYPLT